MTSPEFRDDIAGRVDRLFDNAYILEKLALSNPFVVRREQQRQRGDNALQELLEEEKENFLGAMREGTFTRLLPPGINPADSIIGGKVKPFSMPPEQTQLTVLQFGYKIDEAKKTFDKAALVLQHAEGTDGYGDTFTGDNLFIVQRHPRNQLGYCLSPNFRLTRISDPENPEVKLLLTRGEIHSTVYKPGLMEVEDTVHSLISLYEDQAEHSADISRQSPGIGGTILPKLVSGPSDPDQLPPA